MLKAQKGIIMRLALVSMFAISLMGCPDDKAATTAAATTTTGTATMATGTEGTSNTETASESNTNTENTAAEGTTSTLRLPLRLKPHQPAKLLQQHQPRQRRKLLPQRTPTPMRRKLLTIVTTNQIDFGNREGGLCAPFFIWGQK